MVLFDRDDAELVAFGVPQYDEVVAVGITPALGPCGAEAEQSIDVMVAVGGVKVEMHRCRGSWYFLGTLQEDGRAGAGRVVEPGELVPGSDGVRAVVPERHGPEVGGTIHVGRVHADRCQPEVANLRRTFARRWHRESVPDPPAY